MGHDEVRIRMNRRKLLARMPVLVVFTGGFVWGALTGSFSDNFLARALGVTGTRVVLWAAVAAGTLVLLSGVWMLGSGTALVLSPEGVWCRRPGRQRVLWGEVVRLERRAVTRKLPRLVLVRSSGRPVEIAAQFMEPPYDSVDRLYELVIEYWRQTRGDGP